MFYQFFWWIEVVLIVQLFNDDADDAVFTIQFNHLLVVWNWFLIRDKI